MRTITHRFAYVYTYAQKYFLYMGERKCIDPRLTEKTELIRNSDARTEIAKCILMLPMPSLDSSPQFQLTCMGGEENLLSS